MINFVTGLEQLRIPPGNRLEKLSGDLAGFYSIRINDQFRIILKLPAASSGESSTVRKFAIFVFAR